MKRKHFEVWDEHVFLEWFHSREVAQAFIDRNWPNDPELSISETEEECGPDCDARDE